MCPHRYYHGSLRSINRKIPLFSPTCILTPALEFSSNLKTLRRFTPRHPLYENITADIRFRYAPSKFACGKLRISAYYTIWNEIYHIDSVFPLLPCFQHIFKKFRFWQCTFKFYRLINLLSLVRQRRYIYVLNAGILSLLPCRM